ncbi:MAG: putative nucleotide-diphospho-sugar transferase [Janthinobacterium lividum]
MSLTAQIAGPVSKVLARLHRWYATAWVLSHVPLAAMDSTAVGRLRYALMMAHRIAPQRTKRLLQKISRCGQSTTAELFIELAAMATAIDQPDVASSQLGFARQMATNQETLDAAEKLLHVNRADAFQTLQSTLHSKVDALDLQHVGLVTLVPVSGKYLDLWALWLQQVRLHACRQIVVMSMDDAAHTALFGLPDVAVVDVREFFSWDAAGRLHPHTRGVLWYLRVLLLRDLVQRGHTVLVLDLDAIPVGDVQAMVSGMSGADVIAQKDHSIPMDVDRQLGFVLCCGFMLWRRRTAAVLALLDRFTRETAIERDDQLALNHLLAQRGIAKSNHDTAALQFESAGVRFTCPPETSVSRSLEGGSVVRHFHQTGKSVPEIRNALGL